mmetsp:Transcript_7064/g.6414  ORF Transcript_7064/g.6414 Transcript_7064/m.6414 type:complete len:310 (-) Transcript_7064:365-1294(-)
MDATGKLSGIIKAEARGKKRSIKEQPDEILYSLVRLISSSLLLQLDHDSILGVDLHSLLGHHVASHRAIPKGLSLHDTLHIGSPTVLGSGQHTGRLRHTLRNDDLLNLVTQNLLDELAERLKVGLLLLESLLLLVRLIEIEITLLSDGLQLVTVELTELLHSVLINGINQVEDFITLLAESLDEGTGGHSSDALTGDVIDILLTLLHAVNILLEGHHILTRLGRLEPQQLGDLIAVGGVLVDAQLEVLRELLVEDLVIIRLLGGHLLEQLQALLHQVLLDHTKDLVLLESLTRDVQRKILRVDNSLDEA